ncbi:MAG: DinB family protein [Planctomycetes bacterium]|nr:DinB family protein [Planctomycetota bacterium]
MAKATKSDTKAAPKKVRSARSKQARETEDELDLSPADEAQAALGDAAPSANTGSSATASATPAAPARRARGKGPVDLGSALVDALATSERINQYLLEHLEPSAWDTPAPVGKGRTIRGIVAHLHNVRVLWLSVSAPEIPAPAKVQREQLTLDDAKLALRASAEALGELVRRALAGGGHVKDFKPDVVGFASYVIAHEAHHRGQICLIARMLGQPLSQQVGFGLWEWRKRHAESGSAD